MWRGTFALVRNSERGGSSARRLSQHRQAQPGGDCAPVLTRLVDRRAAHVAFVAAVVVFGAAVERAAVVPDQDVTHAPLMRVDELRLRREGEQFLEQGGAFGFVHTDDAL